MHGHMNSCAWTHQAGHMQPWSPSHPFGVPVPRLWKQMVAACSCCLPGHRVMSFTWPPRDVYLATSSCYLPGTACLLVSFATDYLLMSIAASSCGVPHVMCASRVMCQVASAALQSAPCIETYPLSPRVRSCSCFVTSRLANLPCRAPLNWKPFWSPLFHSCVHAYKEPP
eukprot:1157881-Pelagomonas_calceolata.AAC.3